MWCKSVCDGERWLTVLSWSHNICLYTRHALSFALKNSENNFNTHTHEGCKCSSGSSWPHLLSDYSVSPGAFDCEPLGQLKPTVDLPLYCEVTLQFLHLGRQNQPSESLSSKRFLNDIKRLRGKYRHSIGDHRVKEEIFVVDWTQTPSASAKCAVKCLWFN